MLPDGQTVYASGITTTTALRTSSLPTLVRIVSTGTTATVRLPMLRKRPDFSLTKLDGEPGAASSTTTGMGTSIFLFPITFDSTWRRRQCLVSLRPATGRVSPLTVVLE